MGQNNIPVVATGYDEVNARRIAQGLDPIVPPAGYGGGSSSSSSGGGSSGSSSGGGYSYGGGSGSGLHEAFQPNASSASTGNPVYLPSSPVTNPFGFNPNMGVSDGSLHPAFASVPNASSAVDGSPVSLGAGGNSFASPSGASIDPGVASAFQQVIDFVNSPPAGFSNEGGVLTAPDGTVVATGVAPTVGRPVRGLIKTGKTLEDLISRITSDSKVAQALRPGTIKFFNHAYNTAKAIPVNTANAAKTVNWLSKLAGVAKNPAFVASALVSIIGSYPFAGFIKEEALQTLSFATKSAIDNEDWVGAQSAIDQQKDLLDPTLWDNIMSSIPYGNVINSLKKFYEAANLKTDIDQKIINDLSAKSESGESDDEFYARIDQERIAQREEWQADMIAYYAQVERLKADAAAAGRAADAAYWADVLAQREEQARINAEFDEDYWNTYYKELAKARDNSAPSNLKFGLL